MNVWDGSQWIEASAASQAILVVYQYTATGGQTTFSGTDNNSLTLGYTVGSALVTLNGVMLEVGSEVTATSGTSVVLASGATAGDELNVYAFSTFNLADVYTKAQSDAKYVELTGDTMTGALLLPDGSASAPALSNDGDSNTGIFFPAADTIAFAEGGSEVARFDSSGNLGVGTTSPNKGGVPRAVTLNSSGGNIVEFCVSDTRIGWVYGDNNLTALSAGGSRYIALETNGATRMRINSTGSREFSTFNTSNINTGEATIEWGNISSTTFDITTLFPNVLGLGTGVGLLIHVQSWTGGANTSVSALISGARGNTSWAFSTINNTNTGGGASVSASASGNVVTLSFSFGAQYGKARIMLIATS
jgi:hypothetical protein